MSGGFTFTIADKQSKKAQTRWPIIPQDQVKIFIEDQKMMTAWVDQVESEAEDKTHNVSITGRDITCDLADCSIAWPPPKFGKISLVNLTKTLVKPFQIQVVDKSGKGNDTFASFDINKGETVFEAIDRACRLQGVYPVTDENGRLIYIMGNTGSATDKLIWGRNIKSYRVIYDFKNRFKTYRVHGQSPISPEDPLGSDFAGSTGAVGIATDTEITRYRPTIIAAEGNINADEARARAQYEASHRRGLSQSIEVVVQGWRQEDGTLWTPGLQVFTQVLPAYTKGNLIIVDCAWSKGDEGTLTTMLLKPPEAVKVFGTKQATKVKAGAMGLFQQLLMPGTDTATQDATDVEEQ